MSGEKGVFSSWKITATISFPERKCEKHMDGESLLLD